MKISIKASLFLVLAILGLVGTWYYNIRFFLLEQDTSITNFIVLATANDPAKSLNVDLLICVAAFMCWLVPEAIRLKIKHWWIFAVLTFTIAAAFAIPLFLYVREKKLAQIKPNLTK